MTNWLIKNITKLFANLFHNIFAVIIVSMIGLPVLISWATDTLGFLFQILNAPTPIWATILLVLLVLAYLKTKKSHSSKKPNYKTKYFDIGKYKWKTEIYENNGFNVDKMPLCLEHNLLFIRDYDSVCCPEAENNNCRNRIHDSEHNKIHMKAESYIDNLIRNKKS